MAEQINVDVYQFLSRANLPFGQFARSVNKPLQQPELEFALDWEFAEAPFEITFLDDEPDQRPRWSIGADQYVDEVRAQSLFALWPGCLIGRGTISSSAPALLDDETLSKCLRFLERILAERRNTAELQLIFDQLSPFSGYRRTFIQSQMFDIDGDRLPSHSQRYRYADAGAFVGPGLACLDVAHPRVNEIGWGRILPYRQFAGPIDSGSLDQSARDIRLHCNSFDELLLARQALQNSNFKTCIRSAASAVEARFKFWCHKWNVPNAFPKGMQFHEKIEHALSSGGRPSYRSVNPGGSTSLLHLYRARNAIHEGDNGYHDISGNEVRVLERVDAQPLFESARNFCIWIDSIGWGW